MNQPISELMLVALGAGGMFVARALYDSLARERDRRRRRNLVAAQNLTALAHDLATLEHGRRQINVTQIRELLAVLGIHLRCLPRPQSDAVLEAIRERAGRNRPETTDHGPRPGGLDDAQLW